ncbi:MAG: arginyl-tRNA synthetase [Patescibacteria group bacterium]|nr:arginyl-tRNA synthetase [Patescibacteria group bacterium]
MLLNAVRQYIESSVDQDTKFSVSYIEGYNFGHVSSNVAMVLAQKENKNPIDLAIQIANKIINEDKRDDSEADSVIKTFSSVEVAGPGFINFTFSDEYLLNILNIDPEDINNNIKSKNINGLMDKEVLVEYTDPNPFKVFHIGHLMTNIIGEAIANIYEFSGAKVKRINYQGDIGRHIAISIFAILKEDNYNKFLTLKSDETIDLKQKVKWLGERYAEGYKDFDGEENDANEDAAVKSGSVIYQVTDINQKIYERSDDKVNEVYDIGKKWSMDYFEILYKLLGTKFDKYIMESEAAPIGTVSVVDNTRPKGRKVFEEGDGGAVIYNGEEEGLHNRVFINRNGLPTYEAKDLGNMELKLKYYPNISQSIVITGNEQNDYFKVLYQAIHKLNPELKNKLLHFGHGMMRFADGKMGSRKGNVISAEQLIENVKENLLGKFDNSKISEQQEKDFVLEKSAIAAIKYTVLKQAIGRDIVFDMEKVVSIEGDSGPYLQYTYARFNSVSKKEKVIIDINEQNRLLILDLCKYEDILLEVIENKSPQKLVTYLIELARSSNSWYAENRIADNEQNEYLAYKVKSILSSGLNILGIYAPEKM